MDSANEHKIEPKRICASLESFSDFPGEIRNSIYDYALVPNTPIELAPMNKKHHSSCQTHYSRLCTYFSGELYHEERYKNDIQPSLALLCVSRQLNREAASVFYGQEFRFTNHMGWHILYEWLMMIGEENKKMIKHITVCHPGMTELLTIPGTIETELSFSPIQSQWPSCDFEPGPYDEWHPTHSVSTDEQKAWLTKSQPLLTLASMPELRELKLLLYRDLYNIEHQRCREHRLNSTKFQSASLKISYINLVPYKIPGKVRRGCTNEVQIKINHPYLDTQPPYLANVWLDPVEYQRSARGLFDWVKTKGFQLEEWFYDNHYTYPVPEHRGCNDKEICRFVQDRISEELKQSGSYEGCQTPNLP